MDLVFAPSQVESWPIARLRPYARNAKMHGDDQVAKIAASMAKFGWTVPCMVAEGSECEQVVGSVACPGCEVREQAGAFSGPGPCGARVRL